VYMRLTIVYNIMSNLHNSGAGLLYSHYIGSQLKLDQSNQLGGSNYDETTQ